MPSFSSMHWRASRSSIVPGVKSASTDSYRQGVLEVGIGPSVGTFCPTPEASEGAP